MKLIAQQLLGVAFFILLFAASVFLVSTSGFTVYAQGGSSNEQCYPAADEKDKNVSVVGRPCSETEKTSGKVITGTCSALGVCDAKTYDKKEVKQTDAAKPGLPSPSAPSAPAAPSASPAAPTQQTPAPGGTQPQAPSLLSQYGYQPSEQMQNPDWDKINLRDATKYAVPVNDISTESILQQALKESIGGLQPQSLLPAVSDRPAIWQGEVPWGGPSGFADPAKEATLQWGTPIEYSPKAIEADLYTSPLVPQKFPDWFDTALKTGQFPPGSEPVISTAGPGRLLEQAALEESAAAIRERYKQIAAYLADPSTQPANFKELIERFNEDQAAHAKKATAFLDAYYAGQGIVSPSNPQATVNGFINSGPVITTGDMDLTGTPQERTWAHTLRDITSGPLGPLVDPAKLGNSALNWYLGQTPSILTQDPIQGNPLGALAGVTQTPQFTTALSAQPFVAETGNPDQPFAPVVYNRFDGQLYPAPQDASLYPALAARENVALRSLVEYERLRDATDRIQGTMLGRVDPDIGLTEGQQALLRDYRTTEELLRQQMVNDTNNLRGVLAREPAALASAQLDAMRMDCARSGSCSFSQYVQDVINIRRAENPLMSTPQLLLSAYEGYNAFVADTVHGWANTIRADVIGNLINNPGALTVNVRTGVPLFDAAATASLTGLNTVQQFVLRDVPAALLTYPLDALGYTNPSGLSLCPSGSSCHTREVVAGVIGTVGFDVPAAVVAPVRSSLGRAVTNGISVPAVTIAPQFTEFAPALRSAIPHDVPFASLSLTPEGVAFKEGVPVKFVETPQFSVLEPGPPVEVTFGRPIQNPYIGIDSIALKPDGIDFTYRRADGTLETFSPPNPQPAWLPEILKTREHLGQSFPFDGSFIQNSLPDVPQPISLLPETETRAAMTAVRDTALPLPIQQEAAGTIFERLKLADPGDSVLPTAHERVVQAAADFRDAAAKIIERDKLPGGDGYFPAELAAERQNLLRAIDDFAGRYPDYARPVTALELTRYLDNVSSPTLLPDTATIPKPASPLVPSALSSTPSPCLVCEPAAIPARRLPELENAVAPTPAQTLQSVMDIVQTPGRPLAQQFEATRDLVTALKKVQDENIARGVPSPKAIDDAIASGNKFQNATLDAFDTGRSNLVEPVNPSRLDIVGPREEFIKALDTAGREVPELSLRRFTPDEVPTLIVKSGDDVPTQIIRSPSETTARPTPAISPRDTTPTLLQKSVNSVVSVAQLMSVLNDPSMAVVMRGSLPLNPTTVADAVGRTTSPLAVLREQWSNVIRGVPSEQIVPTINPRTLLSPSFPQAPLMSPRGLLPGIANTVGQLLGITEPVPVATVAGLPAADVPAYERKTNASYEVSRVSLAREIYNQLIGTAPANAQYTSAPAGAPGTERGTQLFVDWSGPLAQYYGFDATKFVRHVVPVYFAETGGGIPSAINKSSNCCQGTWQIFAPTWNAWLPQAKQVVADMYAKGVLPKNLYDEFNGHLLRYSQQQLSVQGVGRNDGVRDPRFNHVLNGVLGLIEHAKYEKAIQSIAKNEFLGAAWHQAIQLSPSEVVTALRTGRDVSLSGTSIGNFGGNNVRGVRTAYQAVETIAQARGYVNRFTQGLNEVNRLLPGSPTLFTGTPVVLPTVELRGVPISTKDVRVALLGDSNAGFWLGGTVFRKLLREAKVPESLIISRGGYGILQDRWVQFVKDVETIMKQNPTHVVTTIGINDALSVRTAAERALFVERMKQLTSYMTERGAEVLLVEQLSTTPGWKEGAEVINSLLKEVVKSNPKVSVIPTRGFEKGGVLPEKTAVHFNKNAWGLIVQSALGSILKGEKVTPLPQAPRSAQPPTVEPPAAPLRQLVKDGITGVRNPDVARRTLTTEEYIERLRSAGITVFDIRQNYTHWSNRSKEITTAFIHGDKGSAKYLIDRCMTTTKCYAAVIGDGLNGTIDGAVYILADMTKAPNHAYGAEQWSYGFVVAGADMEPWEKVRRNSTPAQEKTVLSIAAILMDEYGWTVTSHGLSSKFSIGGRHLCEGGCNVIEKLLAGTVPSAQKGITQQIIERTFTQREVWKPLGEVYKPAEGPLTSARTIGLSPGEIATRNPLAAKPASVQPGTQKSVRRLVTSLEAPATLPLPTDTKFITCDMAQACTSNLVKQFKEAGAKVFNYDIGDGGGSAWGEPSNLLQGEAGVRRAYERALANFKAGFNGTHWDNPDKLSEAQLEKIWDAEVRAARDAGVSPTLMIKNAAEKFANILARRPDLRALVGHAEIEHLFSGGHEAAAKRLADMGVAVYAIEFESSHIGSPTISRAQLERSVERTRDWLAGGLIAPSERRYSFNAENQFIPGKPSITATTPSKVDVLSKPATTPDVRLELPTKQGRVEYAVVYTSPTTNGTPGGTWQITLEEYRALTNKGREAVQFRRVSDPANRLMTLAEMRADYASIFNGAPPAADNPLALALKDTLPGKSITPVGDITAQLPASLKPIYKEARLFTTPSGERIIHYTYQNPQIAAIDHALRDAIAQGLLPAGTQLIQSGTDIVARAPDGRVSIIRTESRAAPQVAAPVPKKEVVIFGALENPLQVRTLVRQGREAPPVGEIPMRDAPAPLEIARVYAPASIPQTAPTAPTSPAVPSVPVVPKPDEVSIPRPPTAPAASTPATIPTPLPTVSTTLLSNGVSPVSPATGGPLLPQTLPPSLRFGTILDESQFISTWLTLPPLVLGPGLSTPLVIDGAGGLDFGSVFRSLIAVGVRVGLLSSEYEQEVYSYFGIIDTLPDVARPGVTGLPEVAQPSSPETNPETRVPAVPDMKIGGLFFERPTAVVPFTSPAPSQPLTVSLDDELNPVVKTTEQVPDGRTRLPGTGTPRPPETPGRFPTSPFADNVRDALGMPQQGNPSSGTGAPSAGTATQAPPPTPLLPTCSVKGQQVISGVCQCASGYIIVNNECVVPSSSQPSLSCSPREGVPGETISISWNCPTNTTSSGVGFTTNSRLNGNATASIPNNATTTRFTLRCSDRETSCAVETVRPSATLISQPSRVEKAGDSVRLLWASVRATSCRVIGPDCSVLKEGGQSGSLTVPVTQSGYFTLSCSTRGNAIHIDRLVNVSGENEAAASACSNIPSLPPVFDESTSDTNSEPLSPVSDTLQNGSYGSCSLGSGASAYLACVAKATYENVFNIK